MTAALTDWLTGGDDGRGIHLAQDAGTWEFVSYRELAAEARRFGAQFVADGVQPGDVVCILMPTGVPYLAAFFGAWVAGAAVCPVVPPSFQTKDAYAEHVAAVLRQAEPRIVATSPDYEEAVSLAMQLAGRTDRPWLRKPDSTEQADPLPPRGLALLQFTSGSTGSPRGARATWANLEANLAGIVRMVGHVDGEATASWLPLHHDMGLIGCLLGPVRVQNDLWLMQPEQFIRRPAQWLECFTPGKAVHTASPAFGFAYLARRVRAERFAALDLSAWRTALVGAEAVDPAALSRFAKAASVSGFSPDVYMPAYGLAEATLAVTAAYGPGPRRLLRLGASALRFGEPAPIEQTAILDETPRPAHEGWLVGHGLPDADHAALTILDEDGVPVHEGHLGEIAVTGPSVTDGYHAGREGGSTRFADGAVRTGDAGFVHGADLYVLGRMGDAIKINGRSVYVEDLDAKVAAAAGIERDRVAVVGTATASGASVVVFAEADPNGTWPAPVRAALAALLGPDVPVGVVAGTRGLIKRTSSGKPRRSHMWRLFQSGELGQGVVVAPPAEPTTEPTAEPTAELEPATSA